MRKRLYRSSTLSALAAFGAFAAWALWPAAPRTGGATSDHAASAVSGLKLRTLYARWRATHESIGGDRNVAIALGASRATSDEPRAARGLARFNLIDGQARVEVRGLDPLRRFEVWLVDNQPGAGASALLDPGDRRLRLGALRQQGDAASLEATLDLAALADFDIDLVVVAARGEALRQEDTALFGMPRTFQRLYTRERRGQLLSYAQGADALLRRRDARPGGLAWEGVAAAAPTAVTAEVVLDTMVAAGAQLFINETFAGNGRTCATCHPASNNFTLDPPFIATLSPSDPLFVAETNPALAGLEDPVLLRSRALITENVDGFDRPGVLRSVNHTFALSQSLGAPICVATAGCTVNVPGGPPIVVGFGQQAAFLDTSLPPSSGFPPVAVAPTFLAYPLERTGWGGDGAPGSGTLREFAIGAVRQHLPKTLARVAGVDFRIPTDQELDALEVFQLSIGRIDDVNLRQLVFTDPDVERGKQIFMTTDTKNGTVQAGKCEFCHFNAGAKSTPEAFGALIAKFGVPADFVGNNLFSTGVNNLTAADQALPRPGPRDAGFGVVPVSSGGCINGTLDVSGPAPIFTQVPGSEPGGFGGVTLPGLLPAGVCLEQFNTPPLIEAADTPPFFHNNAVDTIEKAVATYNSAAFNDDVQNRLFVTFTDSGKIGIQLTDASVQAVAKMLRVLNSLENLRQSLELSAAALAKPVGSPADQLLDQALEGARDARAVLHAVGLHPGAVLRITEAISLNRVAAATPFHGPLWRQLVNASRGAMNTARGLMVRQLP